MELIIKLLFTLTLFSVNVLVFRYLLKMKVEDDALQLAGLMVLFGANIASTAIMVVTLHPYMAENMGPLFASSGLLGGVIFAVASIPFHKS